MTLFEIVGTYIALNAIIFVWLTVRVIKVRFKDQVSLGDNDDSNLRKRIRTHGNFTETVPMALIGLIALAMLSAPPFVLHIFGAGLTIGRLLHCHGMMQKGAIGRGRVIGMLMTLFVILGQALSLIHI